MRKNRAHLLVLAVAGTACGAALYLPQKPTGEPVLEVRGAIKGGPYKLGKGDLASLPRLAVEGTDPETGRKARWEGLALGKVLLDRVEFQRGADALVIRTEDHRAVLVPLSMLRQLQPVLADRADGQPLPERIVAWPNAVQRGLGTDPRARAWWARGVTAFEIVNGTQYLRSLAVPDGAPAGARAGAALFETRCLACHRMRKAGGEKAPDLTRVTERLAPGALERILDRHPGWTDATAERPDDDALRQLGAYLRAVASEPVLPAEEAPSRREPARAGSPASGGY